MDQNLQTTHFKLQAHLPLPGLSQHVLVVAGESFRVHAEHPAPSSGMRHFLQRARAEASAAPMVCVVSGYRHTQSKTGLKMKSYKDRYSVQSSGTQQAPNAGLQCHLSYRGPFLAPSRVTDKNPEIFIDLASKVLTQTLPLLGCVTLVQGLCLSGMEKGTEKTHVRLSVMNINCRVWDTESTRSIHITQTTTSF